MQRLCYRYEMPRTSYILYLRLLIGTVACYQRNRRAAGNAAGSVRKGEASPATREHSKARRGWSRSQGVDQERSAVRRPQGARCKSLPPQPRSTSPNHIKRRPSRRSTVASFLIDCESRERRSVTKRIGKRERLSLLKSEPSRAFEKRRPYQRLWFARLAPPVPGRFHLRSAARVDQV